MPIQFAEDEQNKVHFKEKMLEIECHTLQIILDLCVPEKELAKTRSQI